MQNRIITFSIILIILMPFRLDASLGQAPFEAFEKSGAQLQNETCIKCHKLQYNEWKRSRHSQSWSNQIFQEGYLVETQDRCIYCHAPLKEQFLEIKNDLIAPKKQANEGVNCIACHVFKGDVVGSSIQSFHATDDETSSSVKKGPQLCASCHQFDINKNVNGNILMTPLNAQNTYIEWKDYQSKGGDKTCLDCHMPKGSHSFKGAHHQDMLEKSIEITHETNSAGVKFHLRPRNIGHRLPTGDVFRNITLEVQMPNGQYKVIANFGKKYKVHISKKNGEVIQELVSDTRLMPLETKSIQTNISKFLSFRLRYHFISEKDKLRTKLKPNEYVKTFLEGKL